MTKRKRLYSNNETYGQSDVSDQETLEDYAPSPISDYKTNFIQLSKYYPFLKKHMILNLRWKPFMSKTLMYHYDFKHPDSVYHLSKAILNHKYNLDLYLPCGCEEVDSCNVDKNIQIYNQNFKETYPDSDFPRFLAPCVPNRVSYIKSISKLFWSKNNNPHITDLENDYLSSCDSLKGDNIVVLDIGTGASCIYPLVGVAEYSWSFIATDIDPLTMELAKRNLELNNFSDKINLRMQNTRTMMFNNVLYSHELIAASVCNPPFHSSLDNTNLNPRTFSTGTEHELVFSMPENSVQIIEQSYLDSSISNNLQTVEGQLTYILPEQSQGELTFIEIMVQESKFYCYNVLWFTTLVARLSTLKKIKSIIQREMRQYNMNHNEQTQFLDSKLDQLYYEDSKFKFGSSFNYKIDISQVHICEFRTFTVKLGKQCRWVIAWSYYNSKQRMEIINNLSKISTQHPDL